MSLSIERVIGPPDSLFSQLGGFAVPFIGPMVTNNPLLTTLVSLIPPPADPPPLLLGAVTAVIMALGLQMESKYISVATTDPTTGERRQPNVLTNPTRNAEFLATQLQSAGYFQLNDDQALVVTVDPGNAGYFVVPVTNDWTITGNYWDPADQPEQCAGQEERRRDLRDRDLTPGSPRLELGFDGRVEPGHDLHPVPGPRSKLVDLAGRQFTGGIPRPAGRHPAGGDGLRHSAGSAGPDRTAKVRFQQSICALPPALAPQL
jgi:hypothetical protein